MFDMVGNQVKGHLGMDCIGLRTHGGKGGK
jgi:hypothetical protein